MSSRELGLVDLASSASEQGEDLARDVALGSGYRLGYGGGYFDRTLAALSPRPVAIGVGLQTARLATIDPQPHDVPLDAIVTEEYVQVAREPGMTARHEQEAPGWP